jgi:hypothetical protein
MVCDPQTWLVHGDVIQNCGHNYTLQHINTAVYVASYLINNIHIYIYTYMAVVWLSISCTGLICRTDDRSGDPVTVVAWYFKRPGFDKELPLQSLGESAGRQWHTVTSRLKQNKLPTCVRHRRAYTSDQGCTNFTNYLEAPSKSQTPGLCHEANSIPSSHKF